MHVWSIRELSLPGNGDYDCLTSLASWDFREKTALLGCIFSASQVYCTHSQYGYVEHKEVSMRPIDELAAEICTFAGHINAANHRWLMLIAEFDRRNGWQDSATQSCAHWLNWKCGIAMGAAREKGALAARWKICRRSPPPWRADG
jgi:hypothetical protein